VKKMIEYLETEWFKIHTRKDFPADFELKCGKSFFCQAHRIKEYITCTECVFGKEDSKGGKPF